MICLARFTIGVDNRFSLQRVEAVDLDGPQIGKRYLGIGLQISALLSGVFLQGLSRRQSLDVCDRQGLAIGVGHKRHGMQRVLPLWNQLRVIFDHRPWLRAQLAEAQRRAAIFHQAAIINQGLRHDTLPDQQWCADEQQHGK